MLKLEDLPLKSIKNKTKYNKPPDNKVVNIETFIRLTDEVVINNTLNVIF